MFDLGAGGALDWCWNGDGDGFFAGVFVAGPDCDAGNYVLRGIHYPAHAWLAKISSHASSKRLGELTKVSPYELVLEEDVATYNIMCL